PYTIGNYLAGTKPDNASADHAVVRRAIGAVEAQEKQFLAIKGKRTVDSFHRELGKIIWDQCGMSRTAAGLEQARGQIRELREEFHKNVNVPGSDAEINQALEKAGRVADFFELAELMCLDALDRTESCGAHFREE